MFDFVKRFDLVWSVLTMVALLHLGIVGLFHTNVLVELVGAGGVLDVIYVLMGVAGMLMVAEKLGLMGGAGHRV